MITQFKYLSTSNTYCWNFTDITIIDIAFTTGFQLHTCNFHKGGKEKTVQIKAECFYKLILSPQKKDHCKTHTSSFKKWIKFPADSWADKWRNLKTTRKIEKKGRRTSPWTSRIEQQNVLGISMLSGFHHAVKVLHCSGMLRIVISRNSENLTYINLLHGGMKRIQLPMHPYSYQM